MSNKIILTSGQELLQPENYESTRSVVLNKRNCVQIALATDYVTAKTIFTEGVKYRSVWDSITHVIDPETKQIVEVPLTEEQDLSDYSIPIEIADQLNGVVIVTMGKPTEIEAMAAREAEYIENLRALGVEV